MTFPCGGGLAAAVIARNDKRAAFLAEAKKHGAMTVEHAAVRGTVLDHAAALERVQAAG